MLASMSSLLFGGVAAIVFSALLWSLDGTFLRPQLYTLPLAFVIFFEHALGTVVLAGLLYKYRAQLRTITKKQWGALFWIALFGGALGTFFFTKALFLTNFVDISVVILLQKLQPVFAIALAAVVLRERFPASFYIYASIALLAGYFVTFSDPFTFAGIFSTTGAIALYALLAAFAWGSSTVFGKYSLHDVPYGLVGALRFALTTILLAPFAIPHIPTMMHGGLSAGLFGIFVLIALTSGASAMFLYYYGLTRVPASVATLAELAWPVSAIFLDYMVNGNVLAWSQLVAAAVLVIVVARITFMAQKVSLTP